MRTFEVIQRILCLSMALLCLLTESAAIAGIGSYDSIHEVISQTEQVLRKPA